MNYHAPTKQFTVELRDIELAAHQLRWAIHHIRLANGLDPKGYEKSAMESPQFAESGILQAARRLGIDLGSNQYGELDVSKDR